MKLLFKKVKFTYLLPRIMEFVNSLDDNKVTDFYPYAKEIGTGTANGKEFTHYRIYRGSHTYDTKEMSIFISGIVEECKEQGIDTDTPELKLLLGVD